MIAYRILKLKQVLPFILVLIGFVCSGQYKITELTPTPGGIYLKAMTGRGFSLSTERLNFNSSRGAYANLELGPGAGLNLAFGTGLRTKHCDFELLLEESMIFGFSASTGSNGSVTMSTSFLKTNVYGMGYFKIPLKKNNFFRLGGGSFLNFPGKFKVKLDGDKLGYAQYSSNVGFLGDLNIMIAAKTVYVNPGLKLKIANIDSRKITFTENQDKLNQLDISSIDLYLALQF